MARPRKKQGRSAAHRSASRRSSSSIRIIGGRFRGRLLAYHGDPGTRPMKQRTREAIFNLLGPAIKQKHAIDLFAGTGALGLEALSRGAARATLIERHIPTSKVIEQNVATLQVEDKAEVLYADAFTWVQQQGPPTDLAWAVFCSPPYDYYCDRRDDMAALIHSLADRTPPGSVLVVESDNRFEDECLTKRDQWDVRLYHPAVIRILWVDNDL